MFNFDKNFGKVGEPQQPTQPQQQQNNQGLFGVDDDGVITPPQQQVQQQVQQPQPQPQPQQPKPQPTSQRKTKPVQQQAQNVQPQQTQPIMTYAGAINMAMTNSGTEQLISDAMSLITSQGIIIPEGYNAVNQLKLAYYKILTVPDAMTCNPESVANALMETAIQGLSVSQTQCYYIKYGNQIQMQRSYFGDIAALKRTGLVLDVYARVIYENDEIEQSTDEYGLECITKHVSKFGNQDGNILGAYAVAVGANGYKRYCIMTMRQIQNNFKLSKNYGSEKNKLQTDFIEEGCKRTAIRRLVKMILNTAVDLNEYQNQIIGSYNRTTEDEFINDDNSDTVYQSAEELQQAMYQGKSNGTVIVEDDM